MNTVQSALLVFLLFALSRVFMQYRNHQIRLNEFGFWSVLFGGAIIVVSFPNETTYFAKLLGIGRGVDLLIYASVVTLFYLCFRIYIQLEDMRHEITELVRKMALEKKEK